MRRDIRLLSDMGKFQNAIHEEVANLRREAVSTLHPIGSLVGLKVTESSLEWQHAVAGTWPMEVDSLDAPEGPSPVGDARRRATRPRCAASCCRPARSVSGWGTWRRIAGRSRIFTRGSSQRANYFPRIVR